MPSKSLGTLTLDLIAKIGGYTGPLDKAERKTKESTSNMAKYAKTAAIALASVGAAAVAAMGALVKSSIDAADQLSKSSKIIGIAIEDLSGLKHAADLSGVSFDQLQVGLVKFSKSTSDALKGTGAGADAYKKLGISVTDANGNLKSNYELLGEVADAFSGMEDGARKTAVAQDLLGDSGAKLIPLLNGGAQGLKAFKDEAERLGLIIDQKTGTASENFNDNMSRLRDTVVGLGYRIAAEVAPALDDFTSKLADPQTQQGIADLSEGLIKGAKAALEFTAELGKIYRLLNGFDVNNLAQINEQIDEVKSAIAHPTERLRFFGKDGVVEYYDEAELKEQLTKLMAQKDKILAGLEKGGGGGASASSGPVAFTEYNNGGIEDEINRQLQDRVKIQKDLYDQAEKLAEQVLGQQDAYRRQLTLIGDATEAQKLQYEIAYGSLKAINPEQEKLLQGLAAEVDARNTLAKSEEKHKEIVAALGQAHEENLQAAGKLVDLENYRSEKRKEQVEKELEDLRAKGLLTAEIEADAQKLIEEQEQAHQSRLAEIKKQAEEDDLKRRQAQLAGAEQLFGSLGDLTEAYGGRASRARKAFLIAEKAAAIAQATISINAGIAKASDLGFPAGLAAMAAVAASTAGIISDIQSVNIAHGGLDYVPKETTYLLDKGERVVSPNQNRDLTDYLSKAKSGGGSVPSIQIINQTGVAANAEANMLSDGTMQIILRAVDSKLQNDLGNGRGVWASAARRYGWSTKGAF